MGLLDYADAAREGLLGYLRGRKEVAKGLLGASYDLATDPQKRAETMARAPKPFQPMTEGDFERVMSWWNPAGLAGIVKPAAAMKSGVPVRLPEAQEFSQSVANTKGAQVTPDGLLMRVQRNQMPEQGQMESVRGGVFYLPEGAAQAKHYSTGKNGYGGEEKISGETLIRNPLFAKGGTGGKAPEAAYDALHGKGAYQRMRDEALKAFGSYGANHSQKASLADEFLDKYAPELSGYGSYIVEKSGKGNQLAYALQEAAVGSAVRAAGHDAVLGYSKGKSGPFISELFDVRESHYPDKFGWSRLFDQFEP